MLQRIEWNRRISAALMATSMSAALILGAAGANAENKDSDGAVVTHCDKKGTTLVQGWCPDTGNKHDAQKAERSRSREVETPDQGEPEGEPTGAEVER